MNCPRCATGLLEQVRDGVTIDACPRCRGVWLDRGEIERLQARAVDEFEASMTARSLTRHRCRDRGEEDEFDRRDRDFDRRDERTPERKSGWSNLYELLA